MGKYEENLELLRKAVRCEPVDRVPVVPCGNAYFARAQHVLLKDYITDFDKACDANLTELAHWSRWYTECDLFPVSAGYTVAV